MQDHLFVRMREQEGAKLRQDLQERADVLRSSMFKKQLAFCDDPSRFKALMCPRRAGKTVAVVLQDLIDLMTVPYVKLCYITMTRTQAKRNVWEMMNEYNKEYHLGLSFNTTELHVRSPIGGIFYLGGALTEKDMERYRGPKFDRATIDECGSFNPDRLEWFLANVLEPCLYDTEGVLQLVGTPGAIEAGTFYDFTGDTDKYSAFEISEDDEGNKRARSRPFARRNAPEWDGVEFMYSYHGWSMRENEAKPNAWASALERHKLSGRPDNDPTWVREGLGKWAADLSAFVFKYNSHRDDWAPRPTPDKPWGLPAIGTQWSYVAGVDLGFDDEFALEVAAWNTKSPNFYHVYEYVEGELSTQEIVDAIKSAQGQFGGLNQIIGPTDSGGKALYKELRSKYGIHVEPAQKHDKRSYIEFLNSELLAGRCKVMEGSRLAAQLESVQWEDPRTKRAVHPRMDDDCCDAWLYVFRYCFHMFHRPLEKGVEKYSKEWWKKKEQEWQEKADREHQTRKRLGLHHQIYERLDRRTKGHGFNQRLRDAIRRNR